MNLGGKQDLDALLRSWPATPPKGVSSAEDDRGWDERAEDIVRAASAARKGGTTEATAALFEAPALAPEAGEEAITAAAGEKKMSQEKESGDSPSSTGTPVPSQPPKRQSLKEIAARASQAGARLSQPGAAPPSIPAPRVSNPAPLSRPSEAGKDDSGVINLKVVQDSATAQQRADAEKAKPAQAGLFEDEKTVESAENPAQKPAPEKPANVAVLQPNKKSNAGAIGGIAIAVLGIAAALAIVSRNKPPPPAPAAVVQQPEDTSAKTKDAPAAPPEAATAAPAEVASAAPVASAEPDSKTAEAAKPAVGGPLPSGAATAPPASPGAVAVKGPLPSGKPGDLQSEMAKAVGKDGRQAAAKDEPAGPTPEPAAAKNQNIPEQPSQGAVAAAFGPVMGSAKACVSGADDVSRASVTFSSSGKVTSVSVSGWAAANGKSGCVQAALKAAKVGPFSKPSFTVGVPIRP